MRAEGEWKGLDFSLDYTGKIHFAVLPEPPSTKEVAIIPTSEVDGFTGIKMGGIIKTTLYKQAARLRELPAPSGAVLAVITTVASIFAIARAVKEYRKLINVGNS